MQTANLSGHIRPNQQIRIAIHLPDERFIDLNAVVVRVEANLLYLETFRNGERQIGNITEGTEANVMTTEAWAFCRGRGTVHDISGRCFTIAIHGELEIQQRREYFRLDVYLPVAWSVPDDQQLTSVEGIWKARKMLLESSPQPKVVPFQGSFKILEWDNGNEIEPKRLNLSGGGLRIKLPEELSAGTFINLDIFLPSIPLKAVIAVGSVIRATEVLLNLDTSPSYVTAIRFNNISEKDQERIISYIFNEQRNNLRMQSER